jgi:hypothetical protein
MMLFYILQEIAFTEVAEILKLYYHTKCEAHLFRARCRSYYEVRTAIRLENWRVGYRDEVVSGDIMFRPKFMKRQQLVQQSL